MEKIISTSIIILLSLLTFSSYGQTEWELEKDEDGIEAYTRSREGIKFKEYKVITEMNTSLSQILAVFQDFEVHTEIFPGTEDIKVHVNEPERYVSYIKFDIPFPARDRDAIFDNHLSYDAGKKTLRIETECLADEYPTNSKLIQIEFCEGFWEFVDMGNGKVSVMNQMIVDPAGFAPAFIVNSKTVKDPIKTLQNLREKVKEPKYQGHSFSLLNNE